MTRNQRLRLLVDRIGEHEDREYDGLTVSDTSEVPKGYRGEVLHINDHGNVTLYRAFANGTLREIASCV